MAREDAEVADVRIAHALHLDAGARRVCQVAGHNDRRAAVERKRRDAHARVPQPDELGDARLRLLHQQVDGVLAAFAHLPDTVRAARACLARRSSALLALVHVAAVTTVGGGLVVAVLVLRHGSST